MISTPNNQLESFTRINSKLTRDFMTDQQQSVGLEKDCSITDLQRSTH